MKTFYNEFDAGAAEWTRSLIAAGLISQGVVDDRSIKSVRGEDLAGYSRAHFFSGIAGWDLALNLASWGDRDVWTGSCPCQPFSAAGKRQGISDDRHLWPEFFRLIRERRPATIFGEQVGSKDGLLWLDGVRADLEGEGYAFGAADLCAAGVGAPHIRQRLFWVANAPSIRLDGRNAISPSPSPSPSGESYTRPERWSAEEPAGSGAVGHPARVANSKDTDGRSGERGEKEGVGPDGIGRRGFAGSGNDGWLGSPSQPGLEGWPSKPANNGQEFSPIERAGRELGVGMEYPASIGRDERRTESGRGRAVSGRGINLDAFGGGAISGPTTSWFGSDVEIVPCLDGKNRRFKSGSFPLIARIPRSMGLGQPELGRMVRNAAKNRVMRLKGYGNAIIPELAAEFIKAFLEAEKEI